MWACPSASSARDGSAARGPTGSATANCHAPLRFVAYPRVLSPYLWRTGEAALGEAVGIGLGDAGLAARDGERVECVAGGAGEPGRRKGAISSEALGIAG